MANIDGNDARIGRQLGEGANADVYSVTMTYADGRSQELAMRKAKQPASQDDLFGIEAYEFSKHQIRGAVPMHGPFDLAHDDGETYKVTLSPIVPGKTLYDSHGMPFLQNQGQAHTANETAKVMSQVAATLHETSKAGLVHNDLKPDNIMYVKQSGRAFVIDWGGVSAQGEDSYTWNARYAAPQVAQDQPSDIKNDLYSVGLMTEEMSLGRFARTLDPKFKNDDIALESYIANYEHKAKSPNKHIRAIVQEATKTNVEDRVAPIDMVTYFAAYPEARQQMTPELKQEVAQHLIKKASNLETRHAALDAAAARGLLQEESLQMHGQHLGAIAGLDETFNIKPAQKQGPQISQEQSPGQVKQFVAATTRRAN